MLHASFLSLIGLFYRAKYGATRQLRYINVPSLVSVAGLLAYLLLIFGAFAVRSLSLSISMLAFPDIAGVVPPAASVLFLLATIMALGAVVIFIYATEGFTANPGIGNRLSGKYRYVSLSQLASTSYSVPARECNLHFFAATLALNGFFVDLVAGFVAPFLLLPLRPGETSQALAAAVCIMLAYLNYRVWRTPDQVSCLFNLHAHVSTFKTCRHERLGLHYRVLFSLQL
jgi:hypothetical protein